MPRLSSRVSLRPTLLALAASACTLAMVPAAQARVTKIIIDDVKPLAAAAGQTITYEQISGRAQGELDPVTRSTPSSKTSS